MNLPDRLILLALVLQPWLTPYSRAGEPERAKNRVVVLNHVCVIDGTGSAPQADMTIVISDERISDIFPTDKKPAPVDAEVIDLTGKCVIPGLIDSHVHLLRSEQDEAMVHERLRAVLLGGVTSVRDMAGNVAVLAELARIGQSPESPSPRIYYSALFAGPSFFSDPRAKYAAGKHRPGEAPWQLAITDTTDLPVAIRNAKAQGVTAIKIYADLSPERVTAITKEAHVQGLKAWSHAAIFPARPSDAVPAGVDCLSHAALFVWEPAERLPERYHLREPAPDYRETVHDHKSLAKLLDVMKEKRVSLGTTVTIMQRLGQRGSPAEGNPMFEWTWKFTAFAHRRGVLLVAGTDNMGPGRDALPNLHEELQILVEKCGLKPVEALTAATLNAASVLGAEKDLGTIAPGRLADLVILSADPTNDIKNTRKIDYVIKGGQIHRRK